MMALNPLAVWDAIRSSYWFVPLVMSAVAIALGLGLVLADGWLGSFVERVLPWPIASQPDGAREVLSTIAGAMITVAGVVFSIAIASFAYAASQYGPRILNTFMRDRVNQVALGTFIATYLYCLIVLRTIHGGDAPFVPQTAVLVGIVLAVISTLVLIQFIHHIAESITLNAVAGRIGRELIAQIHERRTAPSPEAQRPPATGGPTFGIAAQRDGYLQAIDEDAIARACKGGRLHVRVLVLPGEFARADDPVLAIEGEPPPDMRMVRRLQRALVIGDRRTPVQDPGFLADQLVEIATRALSPGVNDPYTAITCLDWLGAAASALAQHGPVSLVAGSGGGDARTLRSFGIDDFVTRTFVPLRLHCQGDRVAAQGFLATTAKVARLAPRETAALLLKESDALVAEAGRAMGARADADLRQMLRRLRHNPDGLGMDRAAARG